MLGAVAEGVDLPSLLLIREDLRAAGVLLNQSLRYSYKQGTPDSELTARIEKVMGIVNAMVRAGETAP
jgi:hypothetical protein